MIEPFEPGQVREVDGKKIVSYGTSSYGYDIRCSREFKIFTNINSTIVDPKAFDAGSFVDFTGDVCIIPPNSFALARTVEYFRIPRNVLTICLGKITYARCGIIVNVTPFEPEWEGYVTLEFSNTTPLPAKIYANEGVAQVIFFESDEVCETSYKDRGGKYQGQQGRHAPQDLKPCAGGLRRAVVRCAAPFDRRRLGSCDRDGRRARRRSTGLRVVAGCGCRRGHSGVTCDAVRADPCIRVAGRPGHAAAARRERVAKSRSLSPLRGERAGVRGDAARRRRIGSLPPAVAAAIA